jgi:hypothetical protein
MRLLAASAAVLAMALSAMPASAATTKVTTVPAEIVFANGNRPGDAGNCSAVVFGKWRDVPGTISATIEYTWKGAPYTKTGTPPWDDTYEFVATYTVEPGYHWIEISTSWADGPVANDCSGMVETYKQRYSTTAVAKLTVEIDPAKCKAATDRADARRRKVNKLRAQLRSAETAGAKNRLRARLEKAKERRSKAVARMKAAC